MNDLNYLCIETSTEFCSVALIAASSGLISRNAKEPKSHGEILTGLIDEVMCEADLGYRELSFVAVSSGPGSYTGLRIGVSTAKGICFAHDIPLVAVESFDSMYQAAFALGLTMDRKVTAMIDARRMEVYTVSWEKDGHRASEPVAIILDNSYLQTDDKEHTLFIGNGAAKLKHLESGESLKIKEDIFPGAEHMANAAQEKFNSGQIEDTAYFEPFYLKSFYITEAKDPFGNGK